MHPVLMTASHACILAASQKYRHTTAKPNSLLNGCYLLLLAQVKVPGRVSEEGRSFITSCLQREAVNRPTAAALLRHPWVRLHA